MTLFEYPELLCAQLLWLAVAGVWLLRRNDEIPLLVSFVLFYTTGYRYWAVSSGLSNWVRLSQFGISTITTAEALQALSYIVLGQSCFLLAYLWNQKQKIPIVQKREISPFLIWIRPKILLFGLLCVPLVVLARGSIVTQRQAGLNLSYQVSGYLHQFPFVLIGVATLIVCLWKFAGMPKGWHKAAAVLILLCVANLTFQTSGRFQLIGWLATTGIIFSCSLKPARRLWLLGSFLLLAVGIFTIAGVLRGNISDGGLQAAAFDRLAGAQDANMLDGFVLVKRFFPEVVPFRFGMTHLEVLLRPIPRSLWPGKPAGGGYMVQAGLSDSGSGFTLGISPTLFGDFYGEGGVWMIVLLSLLYGLALAKLVRGSTWLHPFAGVLVRAIVCASLIPLLRGGDIAGIVAWLGMAFWPCFLLLWVRRKDFDLRERYQQWHFARTGVVPAKPQ